MVRFSLVPRLTSATDALGTTAPVGSVIVPTMSAVVSWQSAVDVESKMNVKRRSVFAHDRPLTVVPVHGVNHFSWETMPRGSSMPDREASSSIQLVTSPRFAASHAAIPPANSITFVMPCCLRMPTAIEDR